MATKEQSRRFTDRRWIAIGLILCVIVMMLFVAWLLNSNVQNKPSAADISTIKNVVLTAFNASSELVVLPGATANPEQKPSATQIETARTHAHDVLSSIYAPTYKDGQTMASIVDTTIVHEGDGDERALQAGVRDINWRDIHLINSNTASVTIAATAWSKLVYFDTHDNSSTFNPVEGRVEIYTLTKINGHWLITNAVIDAAASSKLPVNQVKQ